MSLWIITIIYHNIVFSIIAGTKYYILYYIVLRTFLRDAWCE